MGVPQPIRLKQQAVTQFEGIELRHSRGQLRLVGKPPAGQHLTEILSPSAYARVLMSAACPSWRAAARLACQAASAATADWWSVAASVDTFCSAAVLPMAGRSGLGQRTVDDGAATIAGQRNADVGTHDMVFAAALGRDMETDRRIGDAIPPGPRRRRSVPSALATRQRDFMALTDDAVYPVRHRPSIAGGRGACLLVASAAVLEATLQLECRVVAAQARLNSLRFRLRLCCFTLHRFEASGVAELLPTT